METITLEVDGEPQLGTLVKVVYEGLTLACVVTDKSETHIEVRKQGHMLDTPFIFDMAGKFDRFGFL